MSRFKCDCHPTCKRKPRYEIIIPSTEEREGAWSYACLWHLICLFIKSKLGKFPGFGWCKVDNEREMLENLMEEIWSIQNDLWDIKEHLGLNEELDDKLNVDVT